jgi:hypothetical protein
MADDSNDTQAQINEEDRDLQAKERQLDPSSQDRDGFADAGSGDPGDTGAEGEFAHQGDAIVGGAMGGDLEDITAAPSFGNPATGAGGAQPGAIGAAGEDNEYGAQQPRSAEDETSEAVERAS